MVEVTAIPLEQKPDSHESHAAHDVFHHFVNWVASVTGFISLTPYALSWLSPKVQEIKNLIDQNSNCCTVIAGQKPPWDSANFSFTNFGASQTFHALDGAQKLSGPTYGLAGAVSHALSKVPGIGYHLATGILPEQLTRQIEKLPHIGPHLAQLKLANALAAGGIILLGELSGGALEKWEKDRAREAAEANGGDAEHAAVEAGKAGRLVKTGGKALGLFVALPTILAGVGHALLIGSTVLGLDKLEHTGGFITKAQGIGSQIAALLGKPPGACGGAFKIDSSAAAAGIVGLCCAAPAAIAGLSVFLPFLTGKKKVEVAKQDQPKKISFLDAPADAMAANHHDLSIEEMREQVDELRSRLAKQEKEVARSEAFGKTLAWGVKLAAAIGSLLGGAWLFKRLSEKRNRHLQEAMEGYKRVDNREIGSYPIASATMKRPEGLDASTHATLDELEQRQVTDFRKGLLSTPEAIDIKIPCHTMGDDAACCYTPSNHCGLPGNRYVADSVAFNMYKALKGAVVAGSPKEMLLFAGGTLAVGLGAWLVADKVIEENMVRRPRKELDALRQRTLEAEGLLAHMLKDGYGSTHSHEQKAAEARDAKPANGIV